MLAKLDIPADMNRNHPRIATMGYEDTGEYLIDLGRKRCGLASLEDVSLLDFGCGVRFTVTIINRRVPIKRYTGVEVERTIVDFLNENVAAHDARFQFLHWNVHHDMYNRGGVPLSEFDALPTSQSFDIIWAFSVFTHQYPSDSLHLLRLLRKHLNPGGKLYFSALVKDELDGFEDEIEGSPLEHARYSRALIDSIIHKAGWKIDQFFDAEDLVMHSFLCTPSECNKAVPESDSRMVHILPNCRGEAHPKCIVRGTSDSTLP